MKKAKHAKKAPAPKPSARPLKENEIDTVSGGTMAPQKLIKLN